MKKLIIIIFTMLIMVNYVEAESNGIGTVSKIDLDNGYIIIDMARYKIRKGATKVLSGEHQIGLSRLKVGAKIDFISDEMFLTKIRLKTPLKFNR